MNSLEMHREFLDDVREDIVKAEQHLTELRLVERYHAGKLTDTTREVPAVPPEKPRLTEEKPPVNVSGDASPKRLGVQGKMRHEAAEIVLRDVGKPMQIPAITDRLEAEGYEPKTPRKKLANALYTSMLRKDDVFFKDDVTWGLVEWKQQQE